MFRAITSLVQKTFPHCCKPALSLTFRSHPRHFTSLPPRFQQIPSTTDPRANGNWDGLLKDAPRALTQAELPTADELWQQRSDATILQLAQRPPAGTYSGRSVPVRGGHVADAFTRLQGILQRNKVQHQLRLAERHEKKGVKRRRLSSERWRRQFAHEVRMKVQLVAKIRNRGA